MDNKHLENLQLERIEKDILKITWDTNKSVEVEIFWNTKPKADGNEKFIDVTLENGLEFVDPNPHRRSYYILKIQGMKNEIIGETLLPLEDVYNFRDLGGIRARKNKKIKWGIFYRSARLSNLTENDLKYIDSLGLKTILDYRSKFESLENPDVKIKGAEYFNYSAMPIVDELVDNFDLFSFLKSGIKHREISDPTSVICEAYRKMAFNNEAFRKLFECLQDTSRIPLDQHCTSGKDRTGVGSALLLLALGVSEEDVMKDYMSSNKYRKTINEKLKQSLGKLATGKEGATLFSILMEVKPIYLESFLSGIREKYSSIDEYFEKEYNLTKEKREILQEIYLY